MNMEESARRHDSALADFPALISVSIYFHLISTFYKKKY